MGVLDFLAGIIFQELRYTEHKSIILADFNKESESKLFFCCLETFPPYFQPFLKTLVTDISESVSDGQHFPALYFFCKVYIFPLLSLKSSRTIISTDSLHFCSQKIAQQVSKQTNQYFSVSDGQKKSFHSDTKFCPMYSPDGPFLCLIGILHPSALRKRKELQDITKKIKRNKTSKISLEFDRN